MTDDYGRGFGGYSEDCGRLEYLWPAMENVAQALQDMFRGLAESDELWPKRNGVPPKKYGMSLHRRVRSSPPRYQFVPVAPRNQPYQRRAF